MQQPESLHRSSPPYATGNVIQVGVQTLVVEPMRPRQRDESYLVDVAPRTSAGSSDEPSLVKGPVTIEVDIIEGIADSADRENCATSMFRCTNPDRSRVRVTD